MRSTLAALGALTLFGLAIGQPARADVAAEDLPVDAIEGIVRDYLMDNPEVIYEALEVLQARRQAEQEEARKERIAARAADLFDNPHDPSIGPDDAAVTVVEFFDYRCGYCRRMIPALRQLINERDDVRIVLKELPVLGEESVLASRAALAAHGLDAEAYNELHFALMGAEDLSRESILQIASEYGIDADALAAAMDDQAVVGLINSNYQLAQELGIEGTPAFVIGDTLVPGAVDLARLNTLIDEAKTSCVEC
ncbi:MAG: DsbA family protein [Geminicoccaceae bacterium]